jgi:ferredoxin
MTHEQRDALSETLRKLLTWAEVLETLAETNPGQAACQALSPELFHEQTNALANAFGITLFRVAEAGREYLRKLERERRSAAPPEEAGHAAHGGAQRGADAGDDAPAG